MAIYSSSLFGWAKRVASGSSWPNPKIEFRNPTQIRIFKIQMTQMLILAMMHAGLKI